MLGWRPFEYGRPAARRCRLRKLKKKDILRIFLEAEGIVLYYLENDAYFKDTPIRIAGVLLASPVHAYLQPEHAELALHLSGVL